MSVPAYYNNMGERFRDGMNLAEKNVKDAMSKDTPEIVNKRMANLALFGSYGLYTGGIGGALIGLVIGEIAFNVNVIARGFFAGILGCELQDNGEYKTGIFQNLTIRVGLTGVASLAIGPAALLTSLFMVYGDVFAALFTDKSNANLSAYSWCAIG